MQYIHISHDKQRELTIEVTRDMVGPLIDLVKQEIPVQFESHHLDLADIITDDGTVHKNVYRYRINILADQVDPLFEMIKTAIRKGLFGETNDN